MCQRCDGRIVLDKLFLQTLQTAQANFLAELVIWADKNKMDHRKLPVLRDLGNCIEIVQSMKA